MSDATVSAVSKVSETANWQEIEKLITDGQCRIVNVAKSMGCSQSDLKSAIIAKYGDKVIFKRGCKGGVFWRS